MIVAEHLRKTFPGKGKKAAPVIAVDDVSFTAHDGQITGLLGPNGAGKTTTLRMLYTLMQPEKGRVLVDGIDVARTPTRCAAAWACCPTRAACTSA
jgi:sodium transport system ATP-binding protein